MGNILAFVLVATGVGLFFTDSLFECLDVSFLEESIIFLEGLLSLIFAPVRPTVCRFISIKFLGCLDFNDVFLLLLDPWNWRVVEGDGDLLVTEPLCSFGLEFTMESLAKLRLARLLGTRDMTWASGSMCDEALDLAAILLLVTLLPVFFRFC